MLFPGKKHALARAFRLKYDPKAMDSWVQVKMVQSSPYFITVSLHLKCDSFTRFKSWVAYPYSPLFPHWTTQEISLIVNPSFFPVNFDFARFYALASLTTQDIRYCRSMLFRLRLFTLFIPSFCLTFLFLIFPRDFPPPSRPFPFYRFPNRSFFFDM